MEEQTAVDSAPVTEGRTADQLFQEIEKAQDKLESQGSPNPKVDELQEPQQVDHVEPEITDKPVETPEASETGGEEPVPGESGKTAGDDVDEWMKKKGFKSKEDMARSLRNLERELHKRGRTQEPATQGFQPQTPSPSYQPRYQPPNSSLNEIAEMYQIPAEDIKRIAPLINDLADFQLRQRIQPLMSELTTLKRDYQKDSEFKRLESDPLFQDREVLKEMHELAETDPSILERPDYPKILFDESLRRIGRRFVEGSVSGEQASGERSGIPSRPPPSGRGSAGNVKGVPVRPPSAMTVEKFGRLPKAEMESYLRKHGAIKPDQD